MSIAEFSIRRPITTIMCFVSLAVVGLIASFRLPLEALPDISAPFLFVQVPYTGSTPEEVERKGFDFLAGRLVAHSQVVGERRVDLEG